jgi:DNA-binding IclR family transcriptional regulator
LITDFQKVITRMNQSLAHGLEILLLFDSTRPVLTVPEIVEHLRFSQRKACRLIRALVHYGLLERQNGDCEFIPKKSVLIQKGV